MCRLMMRAHQTKQMMQKHVESTPDIRQLPFWQEARLRLGLTLHTVATHNAKTGEAQSWADNLEDLEAMVDSKQHASYEEGEPALLNEFVKLNPQLQEVENHPFCMNLYKLLTRKHRHEGQCEFGSRIFTRESCFLDHREYWEDIPTGLPVLIGHTYCPQHRVNEPKGDLPGEDHRAELEKNAEKLAERGLAYLASDGSWYHGRATLIVIARADVAARITLPERGNTRGAAVTHDMRQRIPEIDWTGILRDKLAQEAHKRDQLAQLAPAAEEEEGDYQSAFYFYCDTANIDREAGFDVISSKNSWSRLR